MPRTLALLLLVFAHSSAMADPSRVVDVPDGALVLVKGATQDNYDLAGNWAYFTTTRYAVFNWHALSRTCPALLSLTQAQTKRFIPAAALKARLAVLKGQKIELRLTEVAASEAITAQLSRCEGVTPDGQGGYQVQGRKLGILNDWRPADD